MQQGKMFFFIGVTMALVQGMAIFLVSDNGKQWFHAE